MKFDVDQLNDASSGTPQRLAAATLGLEAVALQLFDLDIAQAQAPEEEQGLREPGVRCFCLPKDWLSFRAGSEIGGSDRPKTGVLCLMKSQTSNMD